MDPTSGPILSPIFNPHLTGTDKRVQSSVLVRVRKNNAVILGSHVALDPFAVGASPAVNVLTRLV